MPGPAIPVAWKFPGNAGYDSLRPGTGCLKYDLTPVHGLFALRTKDFHQLQDLNPIGVSAYAK